MQRFLTFRAMSSKFLPLWHLNFSPMVLIRHRTEISLTQLKCEAKGFVTFCSHAGGKEKFKVPWSWSLPQLCMQFSSMYALNCHLPPLLGKLWGIEDLKFFRNSFGVGAPPNPVGYFLSAMYGICRGGNSGAKAAWDLRAHIQEPVSWPQSEDGRPRWPSKMAVRDKVELGTHAAREHPLDRSTVHQWTLQ